MASLALMQRFSKGVFQLVGIHQHVPQGAGLNILYFDGRPHRTPNQFLHVDHQAIEIRWLRIESLPPSKGQQPMCQRRRTLRGALRRCDITFHIRIATLRQPLLQKLKASGNARQLIIEIVRQAAGELTHGFHFLTLLQCLLDGLESRRGILLRGDVSAADIIGISIGDCSPSKPPIGALLAAVAILKTMDGIALLQLRKAGARPFSIVGMQSFIN
jgi:hypothetical protein